METNFEYILLKKLIYSGEFFGKAYPIIKKKYFMEIGCQNLFSLISDYYGEYRALPQLVELVAKVKNVPNSEIRQEIINSLQKINSTDEIKNLDSILNETVTWVKDMIYYEALQLGSDGLMKKDDDLKLKSQQLMDERAKITIDSDLGLDFDDINEMIAYYSARNIGIKTQHACLNRRLGSGFIPGTLSFILAASGIGKSLLMTDLISGMIKKKKKVLLVSLEMADREIMKRVHANAFDLPINNLGDLSKTEGELKKLEKEEPGRETLCKDQIISAYNKIKTSGDCGKLFIKDYPPGSFTSLMLEQLVESYRIEKDIEFDIIFVDYAGIMASDLVSPSAGLYSYIKSISEELRACAKKLKLPIISASQLNRGATNTQEGDNSNVSDSLGTVMTADFMLFLLQDEEMKEKKEIICKVTKNRFNGMTDTWQMSIDYTHMRFNEVIAPEETPDIDITDLTGTPEPMDDFSIIPPKEREEKAKEMIGEVIRSDIKILNEKDKNNPMSEEDLYAELGIEL